MEKKKFRKIYIEITNICNLKCSFCPDTKRKKEYMSINNFKCIIKKIKKYTDLITLHIKGEPLLHPNLRDIFEICENENIKVNITTNGTLLKENIEILTLYNSVRQINISLHSININENNEKYNTKIYMKNILESVKKIKEKSNIIISYRFWNLEDINSSDKNTNILKILEEEYNQENLIEKMKKQKFQELDKNIFINQDTEFEWPDLEKNIISEKGTCMGLKNQIGILVNGDVVPCCLDQNGNIKLGNIYNQELEEILNSNLAQKIVKGFNENQIIHELCKRCGFRNIRF